MEETVLHDDSRTFIAAGPSKLGGGEKKDPLTNSSVSAKSENSFWYYDVRLMMERCST
jgi:hypothetical protein